MGASFRAEWLKLRKRRAVQVLVLLLVGIPFGFSYALSYWMYRGAQGGITVLGNVVDQELLGLLPGKAAVQLFGPQIGIGGPLMLILSVLAAGSEYSWGTIKTVLTRRPSRLAVYGGKVLALGMIVTVILLLVVVADAATTALLARRETDAALHPFVPFITVEMSKRPPPLPDAELARQANALAAKLPPALQWPPVLDIAKAVGAIWLIMAMQGAFGLFLSTLTRSTALAVGMGLVWLLVIEWLVASQVTHATTVVRGIVEALPGANIDSLIRSLTAGAAPTASLNATQAGLILAVYTAAFLVLGALLLRTRDVR